MHVSRICNKYKSPEDTFTFNKMLFSIFGFIVISPLFGSGVRGKHNIYIKNCHCKVIFIFQGDIELTPLVSYGVCVLCLHSRPKDLREIKIFFYLVSMYSSLKCHLFC